MPGTVIKNNNAFIERLQILEKKDTVTYDDVANAFSGLPIDDADIDQILDSLDIQDPMDNIMITPENDVLLGSAKAVVSDATEEPSEEDLKFMDKEFGEDLSEEALEKAIAKEDDNARLPDSTRLYIQEAFRFSLLTAEQEVELAIKIEEGLAAKKELEESAGLLSPQEQNLCEFKIRKGKEARDLMINSNLRLVIKLAKKYMFAKTLDYNDLINEGNIGLIKAVDKFDYRKGYKFSTYAVWWIRQTIIRAIADTDRLIRIPVHMIESMNKIAKAKKEHFLNNGKDITVEDLAEEIQMPFEKVKDLLTISTDPLSLDLGMGDDEDFSLQDAIPDTDAISPQEWADLNDLKEQMEYLLDTTMTEREANILRMRFGINEEDREYTLEELGKKYGLTRERIRQIEVKALRKLRSPSRRNRLRSYVE